MTISISPLDGDDAAIAALEALNLTELSDELRAILKAIGADAGDYSKAPELPNQRYIRSGDLGRGWEGEPVISVSGDSLLGVLTNGVAYAGYVQGDEQTATFAGRWRTTDQILDEWADRISDQMRAAIEQVIPE